MGKVRKGGLLMIILFCSFVDLAAIEGFTASNHRVETKISTRHTAINAEGLQAAGR